MSLVTSLNGQSILNCVSEPYLDQSIPILMGQRITSQPRVGRIKEVIQRIEQFEGDKLRALGELLVEVSYTGELPRSAYLKKETYWQRLFTSHSWEELTENRTALGRVVDFFFEDVLVVLDRRSGRNLPLEYKMYLQADKEAEKVLQENRPFPEGYKRVYENLRQAMIKANRDPNEELSDAAELKIMLPQNETHDSIKKDEEEREIFAVNISALNVDQSFLHKLSTISKVIAHLKQKSLQIDAELSELRLCKQACEMKRHKNKEMLRQLDHLVRLAMVDSDSISPNAQREAQKYVVHLIHAEEGYFAPKIKEQERLLSKVQKRHQKILQKLDAKRQNMHDIKCQLDRSGDHGKCVSDIGAPIKAANVDEMRGGV